MYLETRFCNTKYDYGAQYAGENEFSFLKRAPALVKPQVAKRTTSARAGELAFPISKLNARAGKPGITKNHKEHQ